MLSPQMQSEMIQNVSDHAWPGNTGPGSSKYRVTGHFHGDRTKLVESGQSFTCISGTVWWFQSSWRICALSLGHLSSSVVLSLWVGGR